MLELEHNVLDTVANINVKTILRYTYKSWKTETNDQ